MEWCLGCHREPEKHLRPREEVFNMAWTPPGPTSSRWASELVEKNHIPVHRLTDCSTCHR